MISYKYPMIAAAVAAALASGYADAAAPSIASAAAPQAELIIAGSSAAESAVAGFVETNICGTAANTLVVQSAAPAGASGSGNFFAFSCNTAVTIPASGSAPSVPAGNLVTIYYRTEGGSVVGALPVVTNHTVLRLNLTTSGCTQVGTSTTCTVSGTTSIAGTVDGWTGAVTADVVQLGITDVEPGQLTGANFPTGYSSASFGAATTAQMKALPKVRLFDQVFGLAVNAEAGSGITPPVHLSKASVANILSGTYSDWSTVPDAITGAPIASASSPITRVDREPGSGTRTATNIYFLGYGCGTLNSIPLTPGEALNFSTGDELTAANKTAGAIAYTSIDQLLNPSNSSKYPNLVLAELSGDLPTTNQIAAAGVYDYWFEATAVPNTTALGTSASASIASYIEANLPKIATAPASPDVLAIPSYAGNTATLPLATNSKTGTSEVFVNVFTRNGNSCNVPGAANL
jgi:hypothetical protein